MSDDKLVQGLAAAAVAFGAAGVLAPRLVEVTYAVPSTPHTDQVLRLWGSRNLVLAGWILTARSEEETSRALTMLAGMNALDALTAVTVGRGTGAATWLRAALTSGFFAGATAALRARRG
jgi:hypothetical protein